MKISLYIWIFLLINIEKTYLISRYFRFLYENPSKKKTSTEAALYLCYFVIVSGAVFVKNPSPLIIYGSISYFTTDIHAIETTTVFMSIIELIGIISISFYYGKDVKKNILTGTGIFLLFHVAEKLTSYVIEKLDGMYRMDMETAGICLKLVSIILICTVSYLYFGMKMLNNGIKRTLLWCGVVWSVPLFLCCAMVWYTWYVSIWRTAFVRSKGIIVWEIVCFLIFYICDYFNRTREDAYKRLLLEKEKLYYENQFKNMEQSTMAWKKLRHDFKNHMIVLRGIVDGGNQKEAIDYLNRLLNTQETDKKEIDTGNLSIDSIINYKLLEAEQRSVTFHLDLQIPEGLQISSYVLTVVLGNVIDNAITAAEKTSQKEVYLVLRYTKGRLILVVRNPYVGELQKGESGLPLTSKETKGEHGIGLRNVQEIIEKNSGIMEIQTEDHEFVVSILLQIA